MVQMNLWNMERTLVPGCLSNDTARQSAHKQHNTGSPLERPSRQNGKRLDNVYEPKGGVRRKQCLHS